MKISPTKLTMTASFHQKMKDNKLFLKNIPKSFYQEEKILLSNNINSWESLISITDEQSNNMIYGSLGSLRNIKRLRCIAYFICTLNIELNEAALLMHSGLISNKAISRLSPQELVKKTGRFERTLRTGRIPLIDLNKAHILIEKAKKTEFTSALAKGHGAKAPQMPPPRSRKGTGPRPHKCHLLDITFFFTWLLGSSITALRYYLIITLPYITFFLH